MGRPGAESGPEPSPQVHEKKKRDKPGQPQGEEIQSNDTYQFKRQALEGAWEGIEGEPEQGERFTKQS